MRKFYFKTIIFFLFFLLSAASGRAQTTTVNIALPTHVLTGAQFRITGTFDGDTSNTKCRLDGKEMEILAESPRQIICIMPQTTSGQHTITVEEKGTITQKKITAVNMNLSAPKTNLVTGERTTITVTISGLQGLSSNATIVLTNTSPSTIRLSGGNTQTITITPSQVSNTRTYTQTFHVQSLASGNFTVNADLHLPENKITPDLITNVIKGPCDKFSKLYEIKKDSCNKKNCDEELAALNAAKKALEDARNNLSNAQKVLDDWNKKNGTELDYLNNIMGGLQQVALNGANALANAKQALINAMKTALSSGPGANDGLVYSGDQLTENKDHYTEVYPGIFVYSYNPGNHDPKNSWDNDVKNKINAQISGNAAAARLLKNYQQAITNKASADKKLNDANSKREELNDQRTVLINGVNASQVALAKATEKLKEKENAYNKCIENHKRICREAEELKLKMDSCGRTTQHITNVSKTIAGSPANPLNGNPSGTASAAQNGKAQNELNQANDALNKGDYSCAEQHTANADSISKEAEKTRELEDDYNARKKDSIERAVRDADMAKARKRESMKRDLLKLKRKTDCMKYMVEQQINEMNDQTLSAKLMALKEKFEQVAGAITDGLGVLDKVKISDRELKDAISSIKSQMEGLVEQMKKFDELQATVEKLAKIINNLGTLLSDNNSIEGRAAKFSAVLSLVGTALDEVADKFPVLSFLTSYFDYLIKGYDAAVEAIYQAAGQKLTNLIRGPIESKDCKQLIEDYQRLGLEALTQKFLDKEVHGMGQFVVSKQASEEMIRSIALKLLALKLKKCCIEIMKE